jgi:hypothetical protein
MDLKHCTTIGHSIKASHHHQVLNPSIAPPAIGRKIKELHCKPSDATSKHCTASHWVQNQSTTLPASGCKIKALRHHQVLNQSIAPPLGANLKHHAAIRY